MVEGKGDHSLQCVSWTETADRDASTCQVGFSCYVLIQYSFQTGWTVLQEHTKWFHERKFKKRSGCIGKNQSPLDMWGVRADGSVKQGDIKLLFPASQNTHFIWSNGALPISHQPFTAFSQLLKRSAVLCYLLLVTSAVQRNTARNREIGQDISFPSVPSALII